MTGSNPHMSQPLASSGCGLESAWLAAIMIHGRGRDTDDILTIAERLDLPDVAYLAPAACENSWYPEGFMAPIGANQPHLDYALERIDSLVMELNEKGINTNRIVLLGFSQGACLAAEYAMRNARRYGAVIVFTGGLIGPAGTRWDYPGDFAGTPVFFGSSDIDEWVPETRVHESAQVMRAKGGVVDVMIYSGMGHIVNDDEIARARDILKAIK
jgi:phospholipase/carboxylesterase